MTSDEIKKIRKRIDEVDERIADAMVERYKLAERIGKLKEDTGKSVIDGEREGAIIERYKEIGLSSGIEEELMTQIAKDVIGIGIHAQTKDRPTVATLGPRGTFSEAAVAKYFKKYFLNTYNTMPAIFKAVEKGLVQYGVVPIDNSTEGPVNAAYDSLVDSEVFICGEIQLPVDHCLIANLDVNVETINVILSHPQSIAQCSNFINTNFPNAEIREVASTAAAVKMLDDIRDGAAIGTELAANIYKKRILARGIQDIKDNATRFLVLGKDEPTPSGNDRTSIVYSVMHNPGSLYNSMKVLAENKVNMTKIQSRPMRDKRWEYVFFVDFEGHKSEKRIARVLDEMGKGCHFLKVLGSYKRDDG